ncbi:hypothetical protein [Stutzerimonas stutzeri]|uniref:hypothetical protein n=1 Tax=Stutzerimonas stutzeri TaxID=316 RepID=UPI002108F454|nr:hypothetical protein [Stutzerimonas stutzeri]MCQ4318849.1 hypothetical protein [Stutzerimonas stutzeri]
MDQMQEHMQKMQKHMEMMQQMMESQHGGNGMTGKHGNQNMEGKPGEQQGHQIAALWKTGLTTGQPYPFFFAIARS